MDAGLLKCRVMLQSLVPVQDGTTGAIAETWADLAPVWADVVYLTAAEFVEAANTQSKLAARVRIRYRPGVVPSMRVVHGARIFNIEGVLPDKKYGNEYLDLPVSELVRG